MIENIAWDYLEPIERSQILHFRPDLIEGEYLIALKKQREGEKCPITEEE